MEDEALESVIPLWIGAVIAAGVVAAAKGRRPGGWIIATALFPLALLLLLLLPSRRKAAAAAAKEKAMSSWTRPPPETPAEAKVERLQGLMQKAGLKTDSELAQRLARKVAARAAQASVAAETKGAGLADATRRALVEKQAKRSVPLGQQTDAVVRTRSRETRIYRRV